MANILIVDDSPFARAKISRPLSETGYLIIEAVSGTEAIAYVKEHAPDLVTLDLLMPGISGLDTLLQLKELCPAAKYLVISADIQTITRMEVKAAGADAFLNKPVSRLELLETVTRLLGNP
jgi:CheY-like chemotaxis protein